MPRIESDPPSRIESHPVTGRAGSRTGAARILTARDRQQTSESTKMPISKIGTHKHKAPASGWIWRFENDGS